ncbi:HEAT repeat domain-containing protein [Streptomyces sp. NPDC088553]|uniref:HEAT repeat domain-containing protein n=1 Tax=Streptomyces sp. NPDC088553 TaxID=3365864 RepID=UPI0038153D12
MIEEQDDDLLAGLDGVDWTGMHHAYGSAEDVPGLLRRVCGDNEASRDSALASLFSNIFHQGTRYSASPHAVPFLARIAVAGPRPVRVDTLWLLKCLAVDWHDEYDLPAGIDTVAWRAAAEFTPERCVAWYDECLAAEQDPTKRRELEEARAYCVAGGTFDSRVSALVSYDAVRAELERLSCLLDDPDPEVRTRTAYLLAWFPEEGAWTVPLLLARLRQEPDGRTAATELVAAGLVGDRALVPALRPWLDHTDPLLRWAATLALARVTTAGRSPAGGGDDGLVERVVDELVRAAAAPAPSPRPDFNEGNLHGYTARTLVPLADRDPDRVLAAIVDAFGGMPDRQIGALVRKALPAAFPRAVDHTRVPFRSLGSGQQRILRAFAESGPWRHYGEWFEAALRELGLPDTQQTLCAYAGTEAVGRMLDPDDPFDA